MILVRSRLALFALTLPEICLGRALRILCASVIFPSLVAQMGAFAPPEESATGVEIGGPAYPVTNNRAGVPAVPAIQAAQASAQSGPTWPSSVTQSQAAIQKAFGIDFSPYLTGQDPNLGSQVTEAQILSRMQVVAPRVSVRKYFIGIVG
jgi:hypothetical protein